MNKFSRGFAKSRFRYLMAAALCFPSVGSYANYACAGPLSYLGVDAGGDIAVALAGSTPIHKICNINSQGSFGMSVGSCKAVYAALLSSKTLGKSMTIFYYDNGFNCGSLPSWQGVSGVYFVQGPD